MQIKPIITYSLGAVAIVAVLAAIFFTLQNQRQAEQIEMLLQERNFFLKSNASSTAALLVASSTVESLSDELTRLKDELTILADDYRNEKYRNETFEDQIRDLAGTVGDLDKLSKTDEELLQKYSRVSFLNENYVPERLSSIDSRYILSGRSAQTFHARAIEFLEEMIDDAKDDGHDLKVISAYRSFDTQAQLKGEFTRVYGSGSNAFSADQGFSEHQLGTTVDLTTPAIGGTFGSFSGTEAYEWLIDNAHRYGFTLSYPEGNTFYVYEPWHWRFVGTDLARDLHRADAHFYDWDQRKIDEYLITIFD